MRPQLHIYLLIGSIRIAELNILRIPSIWVKYSM